jgi:hypothetical protein
VSRGSTLSYTAGKVGIGTTLPKAALDVRGDIRLGKGSGDWATASLVNLRIIRGTVNYDGKTLAGKGFNSMYISEGDYRIDFIPPFASPPAVTATVDDGIEALEFADFFVAGVYSANSTSVRIRVRQHDDGGTTGVIDRKFHFIAIGTR